ncbi:MAG: isochorismatase family protein [Anaerolineales bacterium]
MPRKSAYFRKDNRLAQAQKMLRRVERIHTLHQFPFSPSQAALLLLDLQAIFFDPSSHAYLPASEAILPALVEVAQAFKRIDRPIILTQHINTLADARLMSRWWHNLITATHPLAEIHPEFMPFAQHLIRKSQYDAFYNTSLEEQLRQFGITQVLIGGVMTHLCCETTARCAFQRGFAVFFLVDGTATYNEFYHQATLLNLTQGFASPIFCNQVIATCNLLKETKDP